MANALLFKNFEAASRKRNLIPFGLFRYGTNIDWIADTVNNTQTASTAAYGSTVTFNWDQATIWQVTLTGDVQTSLIYNASSPTNFATGDQIILKIIQDSTGYHGFTFPSTLRRVTGYAIDPTPGNITTLFLVWRSGGWDFLTPPVVGPSA